MDDRRIDISPAHRGTCDWLFQTVPFCQWWNRESLQNHHGVLWIKGKPGAGKSTLMKHAYLHCQRTMTGHIIASFFFNARGASNLERTPLGMLRSLLYQVLDNDRSLLHNRFLPKFLDRNGKFDKFEWEAEELHTFMLESLVFLSKPLLLLIDALDECNGPEVRKIINFLELLSKNAIDNKTSLRICLSSRHYPNVTMHKSLELVVERIKEHDNDIARYVDRHLMGNDSIIKRELLRKASGIFMWAVLVVKMLNRAYDDGKVRAMMEKLNEVPDELEDVFWMLLGKDNPDKKVTILMLQWVLFAKRQLTALELYFAVLSGVESQELGAYDRFVETSEAIQEFITSFSKGLIEVLQNQSVQFIHGSVVDFLLRNKRLQRLDPGLEENVNGTSHDRLRACCMQYIMMEELWRVVVRGSERRTNLSINYPFLVYASSYLLDHAEAAQKQCVEQRALLQQSPEQLRRLKVFHDAFGNHADSSRCRDAGILYMFMSHDYHSLVRFALFTNGVDVNDLGGFYGNVLQLAAAKGNKETVELLLQKGANINALGGHYGSALQAASAVGKKNIVELLIREGAEIDANGGHYGTALQAASARRHRSIVEHLIRARTNINAQGGNYGTALQAASAAGNKEVVQLLIEGGARVNIQDGYYGSALKAALAVRDGNVVGLLLQNGADQSILSQSENLALQQLFPRRN